MGLDPYTVINDNFVENRGAEKNQACFNISKASAFAYIVCKMNIENAMKMMEGFI